MYAKCQQFKFHDFNSAKIAASYCGDILGKQINDLNMAGLNIFLGKDVELSIIVKFEGIEEWKNKCKRGKASAIYLTCLILLEQLD